jgi:hypothetical protein
VVWYLLASISGFMSFNLPRNQKDLRFTGELRAAIDDQPRSKLGIPRSRKTPQPGQSAHSPDVYRAEPFPTPFAPPPIDVLDLDDDDDDSPTTMLDRDGLDVLPGGFGAPKHKAQSPGGGPVPNFRTPAPMPKVIVAPESLPRMKAPDAQAKAPPLVFWLVAALVLAIVSYKVTPVAFTKAEVVSKRVQAM